MRTSTTPVRGILEAMGSATAEAPATAIAALEELAARFEPGDIDVPGGSARIRLEVTDGRDQDAIIELPSIHLGPPAGSPDARLSADARTWGSIAADVAGGMQAFRRGQLRVRENLHLGVGFLAATTGSTEPGRLRFGRIATANHDIAYCEAGEGPPLICLHGLGGTKASFLPTIAALAPAGNRVIAIDLPGFGDSDKPHNAPFDAPWFAGVVIEVLDQLGLERASFAGNSMGGRIAIELGFSHPDRVEKLVLLAPALAWLKERPWKWLLQVPLPRLGYLQPTPRILVEPIVRKLVPGGDRGWTAAGVDEFLRAYLTPRGPLRLLRVPAQRLPRRALRRAGFLDPAQEARSRCPLRLGPRGRARADLVHAPRRACPAALHPPGARLRPRPPARAPGGDARGDGRVPGIGARPRRYLPSSARRSARRFMPASAAAFEAPCQSVGESAGRLTPASWRVAISR